MRGSVALVADDLTGALDSAAPFAGAVRASKVSVYWSLDRLVERTSPFGISTESRSLSPEAGADRVRAALSYLCDADVRFKKIDSLARGNSCNEIAACVKSGFFRTIIVAPSFPEQGRRVVNGQIETAGGNLDLAGTLADCGVRFATRACEASMPVRKGVVLCDAETDNDLRRIVAEADDMAAPLLFCGSGGLAAAIAPPFRAFRSAPLPQLAIFGSQTAVCRAHLARFTSVRSVGTAILTAPQTWRDAADWNAPRLAMAFDMPPLKADAAENAVRAALEELLRHRPQPDAMLVVGGDTLRRVLDTSGATSVLVHGAWAPGIAVSRVKDGSWAGSWLYSMSGSFDDAGLIDAIFHGDPCSAHH